MKGAFVRQILQIVPLSYSLTDNKVGGENVNVAIKMSNGDNFIINDLKDTEVLEKVLYDFVDGEKILKNRMVPLSDADLINPSQISSIKIEK